MRQVSSLIAMIGMLWATSACAVKPYSVTVPVPAQTLLPASHELESYTSNAGLSAQLDRTTTFCGHTKQAIAREIDQRIRSLMARRSSLLLVGSSAALATTIYSGTQDQPNKKVVVPLSAIAGSALLTALPSLGKDERADALREKLTSIKTKEAGVIEIWNALERGLLDIGLLRDQVSRLQEAHSPVDKVQADIDRKLTDLAPIEERLRTALAALSNECS